ncbi:MAG: preprotein translocase subunit SecA [Candidatus Falkowbacteria bacterium]
MGILANIFGDANKKVVESLKPTVQKINDLEASIKPKSDSELKDASLALKAKLAGKSIEEQATMLNDILPEAYALVREAASRILGQRHYDVQLVGGIILHRGQIAEMKTGEGKTLVATAPLYLNALAGRGVHLVTVNDYLSRVGAGWMAPVYYALGLTTSVIVHDAAFAYDPEYIDDTQFDDRLKNFKKISRQEAYACDITYGTNNEFGFDYLRDNMVSELPQMAQREFYYAIVDEIDSILIDEARTPLIISGAAEKSTDKYFKFAGLVSRLVENEDYNVDEKMRAATLTEAGIAKMEKWLGVDNIYIEAGIREVHHIEQALKAHVLFKKDRDYVVKDGEIVIVDEFTGRLMPGRRYSEGLHQSIEAKENVEVQRESLTLATVTFQNYFRMYKKLSGMTGTAVTEAEEFHKIYNLETIVIPTNRPMVREDNQDLIYRSEEGKIQAVIADTKERHALGQPVLIGTISIEQNEVLADRMEREGLRPNVLNAKNHFSEAEIIAQAGKLGTVTLATNMAGRGVDIILGGSPSTKEEQEAVRALGGLHVIGTERHESRRIDNQLRGRAGRQGDPGSSQFYISTDDDLMRIFGGDRMKKLMATLKVPEDMPIQNKMISNSIEAAQKKVEGNNFDIRKHLVEYDDVINKHREAIYRKRREILEIVEAQKELKTETEIDASAKTLSDIVLAMVADEIAYVVNFHTAGENASEWNLQEIAETVRTIFNVKDIKDEIAKFKTREEIIKYIDDLAKAQYDEMIKAFKAAGFNFSDVEKGILIRSIDTLWIEHLESIDYLRRGIGLRSYGQRDPLVEYKKEAYMLYRGLNDAIQKQVVYSIYKTAEAVDGFSERSLAMLANNNEVKAVTYHAPEKTMTEEHSHKNIDLVHEKAKDEDGEKVGRNDLCPCGSGKKYKKCCGA